jgi:hypothetical protein
VVAVCGGSGGRGSGAVIMTLFCCASGVAVATIVLLVKIGVGMDLFYLNAKKTSVCRLVQNFTSLLASSVQVRARATQKRCTFSCNAFALHVLALEFVDFILRASELHENVQCKSVARFHATRMQEFASFT